MLPRLLELAKKDPYVLWFRGRQAINAEMWRLAQRWPKLELKVGRYWTADRAAEWLKERRDRPALFPRGLSERLRLWSKAQCAAAEKACSRAESVLQGEISLFGQRVQVDWTAIPWHTDWRSGYTWDRRFFKQYTFYAGPQKAEVKYPWELSRLGWLQPAALASHIGHLEIIHWIGRTVEDWLRANPCGSSVNWCPMEASMRAVSLCVVLELLAANYGTQPSDVIPLLRALTLQAEFVWRNTEYTEHRENHFAANIAALGLAAEILSTIPSHEKWRRRAAAWLPREITSQFLDDGITFEKSLAYHRLTTELLLLTAIAQRAAGFSLPAEATARLEAAARAVEKFRHPDATGANFGDNDSSQTLTLGGEPPQRRDACLALASYYFGQAFELGTEDLALWTALFDLPGLPIKREPQVFHYGTSGFIYFRHQDSAIIADFGEVGFRGRGGHGHNDLFSFELSLAGRKIVVDPGSASYTGDAEAYNRYRSSASHNGLVVDDMEIAELQGYWRIRDDARPRSVHVFQSEGSVKASGEHTGYMRLTDPVVHRRTLHFDGEARRLTCEDTLSCVSTHRTVRRLHLAPGLMGNLTVRGLDISAAGERLASVTWDAGTVANCVAYDYSPEFGARQRAMCLELRVLAQPNVPLNMTISTL